MSFGIIIAIVVIAGFFLFFIILEFIYDKDRKRIDQEIGVLTKEIIFDSIHFGDQIRVYKDARKVWMKEKVFDFTQIMDVQMEIQTVTEGGDVTATTTTSALGTIGRAAMGKMLAGNTGAVIGANTAKQTTVFHKENESQKNKYIIDIKTNDLETPVLTFKVDDDRKKAMEAYSTIELIINMNRNMK